jgi:hypothetical protein
LQQAGNLLKQKLLLTVLKDSSCFKTGLANKLEHADYDDDDDDDDVI